jgi:transposase
MPKACSADLRERVLAAVEERAARREAAERFEVSPSSAVKWFRAWEREGRRTAKPRGGSRSPLEDCADEILALVAERPDWTLEELVAALHRRGLPGSRSALWRAPGLQAVSRRWVEARSASMYPAWVRSLGLQATMGIRASRSS